MKKFIAIVLIICSFVVVLCGCTSDKKLKEVDMSKFTDAEEFDIYEWPTVGIGSEIPVPNWSNRGDIRKDSADYFKVKVGYTTQENYSNYVKTIQDFGFVVDYSNDDHRYYAKNYDGWGIELYYSDNRMMLRIEVARHAEDLN